MRAAAPHATGGIPVNVQPQDELGQAQTAYGVNQERLAAIRAKYDPGNRFRIDQNIRPGAVPAA